MKKQKVVIARKTKEGEVQPISRSVVFQPEVKFKGGTVPWFDDSKLLKKGNAESEPKE